MGKKISHVYTTDEKLRTVAKNTSTAAGAGGTVLEFRKFTQNCAGARILPEPTYVSGSRTGY